MKNMPLVSIIMPSYNTEKYISDAINSVIAQSYTNWELLIVDDCSQDNTVEVVRQFEDDRIRFQSLESNSGGAVARNTAITKAKGEYIAFLDSDDMWLPEKLEKQLRFMMDNDYVFTHTMYEHMSQNQQPMGVVVSGPKRVPAKGFNLYCWCGCLTTMYNAKKVGLIQVANLKKRNDYAMWLKINETHPCYLYPEILARYRKREDSISNVNVMELIKHHYLLFRIGQNKDPIRSVIYTMLNIVCGVYKKTKYITKIN